MTCADVAEALDVSVTKVSRMETGERGLFVDDVSAMLGLYRVPAARREELLALIREGAQRNWQKLQKGKLPTNWRDLIRFESDASVLYAFEPLVVPGLLQTPEYASAIIRGANAELTDDEIDLLVSARMTRAAVLSKRNAPALHVVIDEVVLHRPVGGPGVMRRQLQHLAASATRPNVTLRVLPFSAGATPGVEGPLLILDFAAQSSLIYLEHRENTAFLEDEEYVKRAKLAMRRVRDAALAPVDSIRLIADAVGRMP